MPKVGLARVAVPPETGRRPGVVDFTDVEASVQGQLITSHLTIAAMDAAVAAHRNRTDIDATQKRGLIGHVINKGWFGYDDDASNRTNDLRVPLQAKGFTFISGRADVHTDETTGLFSIAHPFNTSMVLPLYSHLTAGPDYESATYLEARVKVNVVETNPAAVVFRAWNHATLTPYTDAGMVLLYKIEKL